ncbi:uncharacterized protein LOC131621747 isoform X2 [Vicia villosa]|nr:uncharacterized protein LOC131621747 isoform X2 [Vicia villosa]
MDLHQCFGHRRKSLPFVEEDGYSASFDSGANNWLAFWLYLVASSYFLFKGNVNFFGGSRIKSQESVSSCNISTPDEGKKNDATVVDDAVSYSEGLGSPNSTCSSTYFDAYSEISDFDRTSYWHSLVNLEEEDSEWLSDSMISENPSSPLSNSGDSFTDFSDVGTPGYWDSLLKLEEEDREWNMGKASYWHSFSLLSLEDEDSEWLSDGDSFTDISDVGTPSYWDSLLRLDKEEKLECVQDDSPVSPYTGTMVHPVLPPISTVSSINADEPLFWPFDGEFDWDSEESSFCNSPRKRLVFDSNMDSPLEYFAWEQEFAIETLVGLKEFDGHEGLELDFEFIGDGFIMLEEFLQ